jgi:hypothetical protein
VVLNHLGHFKIFEGQSIKISSKEYKICSSALGDYGDGKTISIKVEKGSFKVGEKLKVEEPYGSLFQDMSCNAVLIGPDFEIFRALL